MIHQVLEYWVDQGTPTKEDIEAAIQAAIEHNCHICLHWKGPGYQWYGDTYSRTVTPESDVNAVFDSLPKVYGI